MSGIESKVLENVPISLQTSLTQNCWFKVFVYIFVSIWLPTHIHQGCFSPTDLKTNRTRDVLALALVLHVSSGALLSSPSPDYIRLFNL